MLFRSTTSSGSVSTATGQWTIASGDLSTASGLYTTAQAYNSFVVGTCNIGGGNSTSWVSTDPLFEIGNGVPGTPGMRSKSGYWTWSPPSSPAWTNYSSDSGYYIPPQPATPPVPTSTSDAFVVYKNGNAAVQGTFTAPKVILTAPTGDIPMFTGY